MTHLIVDMCYQGQIELLYSSQKGQSNNITSILFLKRIHKMFEMHLPQRRHHYTLFCTDPINTPQTEQEHANLIQMRNQDLWFVGEDQNIEYRRFVNQDLEAALGPEAERKSVVAYVCGPPAMTDWAVGVLRRSEGMEEKRVLCERWW